MHPDPLGTTAFFTDDAGAKIAAISYLPFGNVAASVGDIDERTFGSHPFDAESGLYYMQRRHYDPQTARFLQPDPIAVLKPERYLTTPRAFHPYAYAGNDPVNNADPDGMTFWTVVGAIVGVATAIAVAAASVMAAPLMAVIGLVTVSYVAGAAAAGTDFGEFMMGFTIGLNAGLNAVIGSLVFGPIIGTALGVINFLVAFEGIAGNLGGTFQHVLAWSNWLMPMSWLANGIGLGIFITDVVLAGLTLNQVGLTRINSIRINWASGAIVTHGGALTLMRGAYDLGNFVYLHRNDSKTHGIIRHELGHLHNVAAFGSIWHLVGALDENVLMRKGNAYSEQIAESHVPLANKWRTDAQLWARLWQ